MSTVCLETVCLQCAAHCRGREGRGRRVETEGQTGLDTDQQVPALGGNLKATGEATSHVKGVLLLVEWFLSQLAIG